MTTVLKRLLRDNLLPLDLGSIGRHDGLAFVKGKSIQGIEFVGFNEEIRVYLDGGGYLSFSVDEHLVDNGDGGLYISSTSVTLWLKLPDGDAAPRVAKVARDE